MFKDIPKSISDTLSLLESKNSIEKTIEKGKIARKDMLNQIPHETGKVLAWLVKISPTGLFLEFGTSAGYSGIWILLGLKGRKGCEFYTHEINENKLSLAKDMFTRSGLVNQVKLISGDGLEYVDNYNQISFCFIDFDNRKYLDLYIKIIDKVKNGGYIIADNIYSSERELKEFIRYVDSDSKVDVIKLPLGKGLLIARKI